MNWRNAAFPALKALEKTSSALPSVGAFRPQKGVFSALALVKNSTLTGGILACSQEPGPVPPGSMTEKSRLMQNDHQPWPLFWARSDDARLVGKIRDWRDSRDRICIEGCFHYPERRRLSEDRLTARVYPGSPLPLEGAWTSIASTWGDGRNYYHWFTDALTRLLVRESLPETTRVIVPAPVSGYMAETLEILGMEGLCFYSKARCLQPERFYFCSPTAMSGAWNPIGFDWLRTKFSPWFTSNRMEPVFLTRRGGTRTPGNIKEIEDQFRAHGFRIVDCGQLSVKEQIAMASAAPAIAGIHGAAMTNLFWARPGTPVLELFQSRYLNACYEQIAFQGKLDYHGLILDEAMCSSDIKRWLKAA